MTDREILINLIAGMHLADHLGDVFEDCLRAAKLAGLIEDKHKCGALNELGEHLAKRFGATTVWGTSLLPQEVGGE